MRDIIISLLLVGLFPACFRRPFVGLCVFTWLAYMRVQDLSWGFARGQRWSYYVAILMFAGYFLDSKRKRFFTPDPRCYLMIVLVIWVGIGIALSKGPSTRQIPGYLEFVKIIVIALFTTGMVTDRERLRILCWIIALSLGFYGVKTGLWGIASGGAAVITGPGGLLADNNDFSMAMAMAVPMLFELGWTERRPELRRAFWFAVPLTVMTVGLTRSRGGFLAVTGAIGVLVWRSRNRLMGILVGMLIALSAWVIAPEDYKERISTITDPTKEGSANSRLVAWKLATRMATDNPWFGVGLDKFTASYSQYKDLPKPGVKIVAHSSYFQMWAECGTVALLLYLTLIFWSFLTCWKVRKLAKARYFSSWIINYATMFEASLFTFAIGAAFLNRAHFDLFYHWVALIIVFGRIAMDEMRNEEAHPVKRTGVRGELVQVRRTGFDVVAPKPNGFLSKGA